MATGAFGAARMPSMLLKQLQKRGYSAAAAAQSAPLKPQNVWCIGRNYAEHIKELDSQAPDGVPLVFLKAGSSVLAPGGSLPLPSFSKDIHHEVELALELGPDLQPVRGLVALDLTLRDLQAAAKRQGYPWTLSKSFVASTPLGTPFSLAGINLDDLELELLVNGKARQRDSTASMLFKVPVLLKYLLEHFPVVPGDLLLTGTPKGVSALKDGDRIEIALRKGRGGELLSSGAWTAQQKVAPPA